MDFASAAGVRVGMNSAIRSLLSLLYSRSPATVLKLQPCHCVHGGDKVSKKETCYSIHSLHWRWHCLEALVLHTKLT